MKPDNRTAKRRLGDIGEKIACEFLRKRGYEIVETNYLRKWGEIDVVAKKGNLLHFIEVKSVSGGTSVANTEGKVTYGTPLDEGYRPEDNMHPGKLRRLSRTIRTYLLDRGMDCDFQLDLITVKIDGANRQARVEIIEDIVI
jgi:putative endonuclease